MQKNVTHIAAHDVALALHLVGNLTYQLENRLVDVLQYELMVNLHFFCKFGLQNYYFFALFLLKY